MEEAVPQPQTPAGYGKRPLWQWIVLYVVIGAIVYGLVYYFVFSKNGMYSTGQNPSPTTAQAAPSSAPSSTTQSQNVVTLTANGFSPATLTIKAGQTVTWINKSGEDATVNSDPHPVHTDFPPLNLGSFANNASLSLTFSAPGRHGYHNHLNPSETGTILVQ